MKAIEKTNSYGDTQIFEILESRKELASYLRDAMWESVYSSYAADEGNLHRDGDTTIAYYNKDGSFVFVSEGDKVKRPNVANIVKLVESNSATTVIYGNVPIVYNEHYGDWEINFD